MKPGFVMYFENCQAIRDLPNVRYAVVVRALMEYAELLAKGQGEEEYLEQQIALLSREDARLLSMMAGSVRRDHQSYLQTVERRTKNKSAWQKEKNPAAQPGCPPIPPDVYKHLD